MINNANVLAIDTSSIACSVALKYNNNIEELHCNTSERATKLLTIIEKLLSKIPIKELTFIAFAAGPGSLTGLKVGSCVVQALSLVYKKPVLKISTLQALALAGYDEFKKNFIIPCMDAKMNQIYYAVYDFSKNIATIDPNSAAPIIPNIVQKDTVGFPKEIIKFLNIAEDLVLVGDGVPILSDKIQSNDLKKGSATIISSNVIKISSKTILKLANNYYQKYGIINDNTDPIYLCSYI